LLPLIVIAICLLVIGGSADVTVGRYRLPPLLSPLFSYSVAGHLPSLKRLLLVADLRRYRLFVTVTAGRPFVGRRFGTLADVCRRYRSLPFVYQVYRCHYLLVGLSFIAIALLFEQCLPFLIFVTVMYVTVVEILVICLMFIVIVIILVPLCYQPVSHDAETGRLHC
jgi:hypothetical protein